MPVVLFQIFMRNVSEPLPFSVPSTAVSMNPKSPPPLMVPEPLNCALDPAITSQSKDVALKFRFPAWYWNSVFPSGWDWPFLYFATKPKLALPVSAGFGTYDPAGELIQPPPVTKPPLGS